MVWCGVGRLWCGVVWCGDGCEVACGVVWGGTAVMYSVVWCGDVQYGVVWGGVGRL